MLTALSLVALVYYGRGRFSSAPDQPSQADSVHSEAGTRSARDLPPSPFTLAPGNGAAPQSVAVPPAPSDPRAGGASAASPIDHSAEMTTGSSSDQPPGPANLAATFDDSVIGRPFPVSASVMATCQKADARWAQERREGNSAWSCATLNKLLPDLAKEPRDEVWATKMEKTLRDLIIADGRPFDIRALECRTTLCAIEASSLQGLAPDVPLQVDLATEERMYGYEKHLSGGKVTVTLSVYKRW